MQDLFAFEVRIYFPTKITLALIAGQPLKDAHSVEGVPTVKFYNLFFNDDLLAADPTRERFVIVLSFHS